MTKRRYGLLAAGLVVMIVVLASSVPSGYAGGRVFVGVGVGVPLWYPYPYPYPYTYPYPVYSPPVVQSAPPVYVEQAAPPQPQYWYYCQSAQAYYPYVRECPDGWMQVIPQASPGPQSQPPNAPR